MDQPQLVELYAKKATPQYGFHKGIKEFGNDDREATKQELHENLFGMDDTTMIKPEHLEKDMCLNVLTYLMFLKQKRTGKIKARVCVDGRLQQEYIGKEEASSPTVNMHYLLHVQ